ncbi:activating transcription factor 7-interacting protein 1 isoform X1 [Rhizophagus irregularis DAOM 181602=DAOM 197198]|nr:activating transcription factor 7-interacting protein 1 isoform X1 [Rhizophagus irregularis DAOM 181602=DAOM 197198]
MPPQKSQNKSKKNKKTFTYVAPTEEEIKSMQTAARGKATHNSTSTWINALETFRKDIGLPGKIDDVNSKEELEHQLVLFFVSCKQQNGAEYSIKLLTDQGLGEIHGADAFTQDEIRKIINHPTMQPDSPKGLIRRIFWHNAFELALRGGEHYNLKIQQFKKRKDGGIDVTFYRSKCNQRSLSESNSKAEVISIPADNAVIQDYELYFSKRPPICEDAFYLQPCNNNEVEFTGYWFKSAQMGEKLVKGLMKEIATITEIDCDKRKFTNHSGRKTFIQISKSEGISDNDVMSVSRHKNPHSLAYYERPKSILQQNTLSQINSLIYNDTLLSNDKTANSFSSALETFNESRSPLQQLNSNDLNELNDDQQNQEINGNDETIKKILHGNVFQNCNITFNVNK